VFILDVVELAVIQQQFWMKECDIFRGQNILYPPTYFQGSGPPTPRIYAPACIVHSMLNLKSSCSSEAVMVSSVWWWESWRRTRLRRWMKSSATWSMTSTYASTSFSGSSFRLSTRRGRYHSSPCLLSVHTYRVGHLIEKISLTINRARCRLINQ